MVKKLFAKGYLCVILAVLYLPIILIIVYSFSNSSNFSFAKGFSFGAYEAIVTSPQTPKLMKALENTFIIAAVSSVAATILGTLAAIGIFTMKSKLRGLV
ncbi:MAG TPA: ABC transporter permease, partial [Clostridia bacterium]|nr:ABC transporter permease [Clostridia bacterium]